MLLPARLRVRLATPVAVLSVAVGLIACGSDADTSTTTSTTGANTSSTAGHGDHAAGATPSAETLKGILDAFADPAKPTADKTALVVGGEKRTASIDQMNQALAGYGKLTFAVANVTTQGDTATAQVTITSPHGSPPAMPMTWEHVEGTWKLSDQSGCLMLGFAQVPCVPA